MKFIYMRCIFVTLPDGILSAATDCTNSSEVYSKFKAVYYKTPSREQVLLSYPWI
jgi:hypothetical protein